MDLPAAPSPLYVTDRLTRIKAEQVIAQGYVPTGFVLTDLEGNKCLVDLAAVCRTDGPAFARLMRGMPAIELGVTKGQACAAPESDLDPTQSDRNHFRTARYLATKFAINRYLMSNAEGRLNGSEKADRHDEPCRYYACLFLDHGDPDTVRRRSYIGEAMWQAIHKKTQDLTGYMDERIGFPLTGRPDYDRLAPLFFDQFDLLAREAAAGVLALFRETEGAIHG